MKTFEVTLNDIVKLNELVDADYYTVDKNNILSFYVYKYYENPLGLKERTSTITHTFNSIAWCRVSEYKAKE